MMIPTIGEHTPLFPSYSKKPADEKEIDDLCNALTPINDNKANEISKYDQNSWLADLELYMKSQKDMETTIKSDIIRMKRELLSTLIKHGAFFIGEKYTQKTWKAFLNAYSNALSIMRQESASISQLSQDIQSLQLAMGKLKVASKHEKKRGNSYEQVGIILSAQLKTQMDLSINANMSQLEKNMSFHLSIEV